jgi:hypothetical protein
LFAKNKELLWEFKKSQLGEFLVSEPQCLHFRLPPAANIEKNKF